MKCILISLCLLLGCAQSPEDFIKSYEQAHNSRDVQKTISLYDDSISFEIKGVWIKKGKEKMRELAEWDSTLNSNLTVQIINANYDTLLCRVIEKNDWFKAAGISEVIHDSVIFIINKGKIKSIMAFPSVEHSGKIMDRISLVYKWSNETGDSTIYGLIKDGEFIYSPEAANKWLNLFKAINKTKLKTK